MDAEVTTHSSDFGVRHYQVVSEQLGLTVTRLPSDTTTSKILIKYVFQDFLAKKLLDLTLRIEKLIKPHIFHQLDSISVIFRRILASTQKQGLITYVWFYLAGYLNCLV